jgi:MEMO1 family protein
LSAQTVTRENRMAIIREPAVSGTFYPGNPKVLRKDVETYLRGAGEVKAGGDVTGIIAPHAGYMYSGQVAAYGFKAISGAKYDTVVVIAPSHRARFEGVAILDRGSYRTPLGLVDVDEEAAADLMKQNNTVGTLMEAHRYEHALEVQLPFLQVVLEGFKIVPLIMGSQSAEMCERLASSISGAAKGRTKRFLVVGSTDLSHYHPQKQAVELDNVVVRHLEAFDAKGMVRDLEKERLEACGAGPMITAMMVSKSLGAKKSRVLKYATSGDVSGDTSSVVGYVSCIFYGEPEG